MRRNDELLLRLHHFRHRTDGVELDIIQREVITDTQYALIEVHHRDTHVVIVLLRQNGLGALVPEMIAVFRFTQIQYL